MKRFFIALLSAVLIAAPAFARGPWDAGIPGNPVKVNPANINGSYQGSIKGTNLTGIMRFTTSSSGQIPVTTTIPEYVITGTGAAAIVHVVYVTTTTYVSATGYANFFMEGSNGQATLDTAVDLGARTLNGLLTGAGARALTQILTRPSDGANWTIANNIYFNGYFDGKLSKNWAANSFTGKGTITVTKVDIAGFYAALGNPATAATATPQVVTVPMSIKVAGVKTTDVTTTYAPNMPSIVMPTVTLN